jgi:hypothetical protein
MGEPEPPAPDADPDEATPFEDIDVDPQNDSPPTQDETLPEDEKAAIAKERDEIILSNSGRAPDEQISVDPSEVN